MISRFFQAWVIGLLFLISSCAPNYYLSKEFLKEQMYTEAEYLQANENHPDIYKFSGFERIKCFDEKGNIVVFPIDSKTRVVFRTKSGMEVPMHFASITYVNDTLTGNYSSTLNIEKVLPFSMIDTINVYSELKMRKLERE